MGNRILFDNRRVYIGYKGNTYGKQNCRRKKPATYEVGDFHYFFVADMRPTRGAIWYPCMPDPEGTTTPVHFVGRNIPTSLGKVIHPRYFFCPSQWEMLQEPDNPVPQEKWNEAVQMAKELLLRFLISLIAHQTYWNEMGSMEPSLRKRLDVGGVLDEYSHIAREILTRDRIKGMIGWDTNDGCDIYFKET